MADPGNVWLIAEGGGEILAYVHYSAVRERSAYRYTVENSISVRDDVHCQGVGKALVAELIARAEAAGFRQMLAVIGDPENAGSIGLHVSLGFKHIGTMRAVGMKLGGWVDVVTTQLSLGEGVKTLPAD